MLDIREVDYVAKLVYYVAKLEDYIVKLDVSKHIYSMFKLLLLKITLLLILCSPYFNRVSAQNDSTLIQLKAGAFAAFEEGESDTARVLFKQIIANYVEQPRIVGMCYNILGVIDLEEGFNTRALSYSEKGIEVYRKSGSDTLIAISLYNTARIYKRFGQYEKAVKYLLEAATFFEKKEMLNYLAMTYNVLANIYKVNTDFKKAIEFHNNAIIALKGTDDSLSLIRYINNRGKTYLEIEYFDLALTDFKMALDFKIKTNAIKSSGYTYYNLGEAEYLRNNLTDAKSNFIKALNIHEAFNNDREIAFTANYLGEIAGRNQDWAEGVSYFEKTENIASKLEDYDLQLSNYQSQSNFYEKKKEFEKALAYSTLHNTLYKEILNIETKETIGELQIKYEVTKVEQENLFLAQQTEIDGLKIVQQDSSIQVLKNATIASLILIICILLLGYWFYHLSKKAKKQAILEKALAVKEKHFNTEQHHRIKNHLQLLSGLLSFQQRKLENLAAKEVIQESSNRVKVITTLHQHLYQSDDLSKTVIQLDAYLESLIGNLSLLFKEPKTKVIIELDPVQIEADRALPLGLICNEIITNAFKYGLTNSDTSALRITLKKKQQKDEIFISDNGAGNVGKAHSSSIGLELITQMVKRMDAKLEQQNNNGTSYTLTF